MLLASGLPMDEKDLLCGFSGLRFSMCGVQTAQHRAVGSQLVEDVGNASFETWPTHRYIGCI